MGQPGPGALLHAPTRPGTRLLFSCQKARFRAHPAHLDSSCRDLGPSCSVESVQWGQGGHCAFTQLPGLGHLLAALQHGLPWGW